MRKHSREPSQTYSLKNNLTLLDLPRSDHMPLNSVRNILTRANEQGPLLQIYLPSRIQLRQQESMETVDLPEAAVTHRHPETHTSIGREEITPALALMVETDHQAEAVEDFREDQDFQGTDPVETQEGVAEEILEDLELIIQEEAVVIQEEVVVIQEEAVVIQEEMDQDNQILA
ncbi:hypothetical protein K438DRAFT_1994935 [Mycena galopus ATCC 62051]|nr:hypothetical protein K438DRAFT_1994935 [Mycena galopus ATCC 62051]